MTAVGFGMPWRRWMVGGIGATGMALLAVRSHVPVAIYNASPSAPVGFYRVLPAGAIERGTLILVRMPDDMRELAATRDYVPATVPLVKRVAARAGDRVCLDGDAVMIDGRHVADRRRVDAKGRDMPAWRACRLLGRDEIFVLMEDVPDSFDSRYFGPVSASAVIGRLVPLRLD